VAANFATWDANHDQTLSTEELDAAIEDPANKGPAAAALAALRRAGSITNVQPLTLDHIRKLADDKDLKLWAIYRQSLARINRVTHHEVFVSGLPRLSTIHQGRMGNCFTLAPLGAMVYRDPHEVASWFEVQSNGNVLVKMAGGPVSVPPPTDAELAFAAANTQDGTWINLYEKAIGQARNERKPPGKRFDVALDAIAKGGTEEPIMSYITGHKVGVYALGFDSSPETAASKLAQMRQRLAFATSNRLLMVCATVKPSVPGLSPRHAYALLNYDALSDTVKLWNPHGNDFKPKGPPGLTNGYPMTNGIFNMPLTDWTKQFFHVAIERPELTPLKWTDQWELIAQAGRFAEAASDLAEVIDLNESQNWKLYLLTPLLIQSGRIADYTNHCKSMLDRFENTTDPSVAERTAKSCLLLPQAVGTNDLARATKLAAHAVSLSKEGDWMHWRLMTRGLAEYRSGRYDDALQTEALAQKAAAHARELNAPACEADTYFVSAMAHAKLKQKRQAHADLERALNIVQTKLPKLDNGDLGQRWFDTLMADIILREARETVEGVSTGVHTP
jgi:tetratricopeptide (TPR) repeat protein